MLIEFYTNFQKNNTNGLPLRFYLPRKWPRMLENIQLNFVRGVLPMMAKIN